VENIRMSFTMKIIGIDGSECDSMMAAHADIKPTKRQDVP